MRPRSRLAFLLAAVAMCVTACSSGLTGAQVRGSASPAAPPIVYAAIGASETVGVGATDPTRDAWPQVLYRTALPESAVFYNFGIPGATVQTALDRELPAALTVRPTLVTVWLNVNDLVEGLGVAAYEAQLDQLIHALRQGGATRVLVANTPFLDRLPVYLACLRASSQGALCPTQVTPDVLNAAVAGYNASIARVVNREGAILVDLHSQGEVPDLHPDWVSSDGYHPSTSGYAAIASEFAAALKSG